MTKWCGGWATRQGRVVAVPTAADLSKEAIPDAAYELDNLIRYIHGDIIVFGHSQGAQVAGVWLDTFGVNHPIRDIARVRFVLTGNLERQYFGYAANKPKWVPKGNIQGLTRNDTGHEVTDIGRKGDLWANYPGGLWSLIRLPFCLPHLDYGAVDPDNLEPVCKPKKVGGTTYYTVA